MSAVDVDAPPSMLVLLRDPANLCTLAGVLSGLAGIYLAVTGELAAAAALGVVAVILDCFDGPIARRTKNRPSYMPQIGLQLDSLADMVCSGAGPAILVLAVGDWQPWLLVVAGAVLAAGTLRLAYFNVAGLSGDRFLGLPIFYSPFLIAIVLLGAWVFEEFAAVDIAPAATAAAAVTIAALNVAPVRVPKLRGRFFTGFLVAAFALTTTLVVASLVGDR